MSKVERGQRRPIKILIANFRPLYISAHMYPHTWEHTGTYIGNICNQNPYFPNKNKTPSEMRNGVFV